MYTSFYNLDKKPFEKNPDPSFLWFGEKHKEAFSTLLYGIEENKGFLLLTGAAGTGKTILVKALVKSLDKDVEWAVVADPIMERVDFYNAIARGFNIDKPFTSKVQFLIQFSHFLHKANEENKKVLLLIDDCHLLSQEMLEDLRLLSNIEKADVKLINIFFVGQPGFNDMLLQPKNRAVQQRLTIKSKLDSFDVDETDNYIRHRLKVAGTEEKLFSAKAVKAIHRFSLGVADRINAICTHALVSGSAKAMQTIDNKVIEECVQESVETFFDEKSIPKPAKKMPSFLGFILEKNSQYGWLKYGLGVFVLLVGGGYFWFSTPQSLDSGQEVSAEIADVPVVNSVAPASSSPAVAMLEQNTTVTDGKKAAELKSAIPENAYSRNEPKEEGKDLPAGEVLAEEATPALGVQQQMEADVAKNETAAGPKASGQQVDMKQDLEQEKDLLADNSASNTSVLQIEVPERTIEVPVAVPLLKRQEKVVIDPLKTVAPLEPKRIILGLRPNSLKLTNVAQRELNSFVKKLKLYPRATVYVKGFVSAKSNSPENIKLSEDRALIVQKLMLAKGIEVERMEVVGMGNQEPIASNDTSEGRRKNRRVEVIVINDGT
ncbi:MAG: AAA family ATPase [Desulfobulbaceae bacterium]|nr:AAA family ATPase [Desulfobulbaceae bacterium]